MPLQCDPTVIYALMLAGRWNGNLTQADLQIDSPYNTYRYPGLPPGPIASPGRASLDAAVASRRRALPLLRQPQRRHARLRDDARRAQPQRQRWQIRASGPMSREIESLTIDELQMAPSAMQSAILDTSMLDLQSAIHDRYYSPTSAFRAACRSACARTCAAGAARARRALMTTQSSRLERHAVLAVERHDESDGGGRRPAAARCVARRRQHERAGSSACAARSA